MAEVLIRPQQTFRVSGQLIRFEIDPVTDGKSLQGRGGPCVRDHGEGEVDPFITADRHSEADAIHSDAGFFADVTTETGFQPAQLKIPGVGKLLESNHLTRSIDMSTDEMTSKPVAESQGRFEIDGSTTIGLSSEGGAMECLLTHIGAEPIRNLFRNREADAVHSNAVTQGKWSERITPGDDHSACTAFDLSDGQHQACEHRLQGSLWP